jgi:hypothetical protein
VWDAQAQAPTLTTVIPTSTQHNTTVTVTVTGKGFKKGMTLVYDGYKYFGVPVKLVNQYKATATFSVENAEVAKIHLTYNGDLSNTLNFNVVEPMRMGPPIINVPNPNVTLTVTPDPQ